MFERLLANTGGGGWRSLDWIWPLFGSTATASQTTNLKVRIHAIPHLSEHDPKLLKWQVVVSVDDSKSSSTSILEDVATPATKAEHQWYLEQYAQQDPFAVSRARDAQKSLASYAKLLSEQIELSHIISPLLPQISLRDTSPHVEIEVSEEQPDHASSDKTIHELHWETLEDTSQWLPNATVLVRRHNSQTETNSNTSSQASALVVSRGSVTTLNLLLVVARDLSQTPASYQDVTPSLASGILSRLGRKLSQLSKSVRLIVEIVRPGTLDALEKHLEQSSQAHEPGFFHIIHFDLHGTVRKSQGVKTAFLSFASPTSDRTVLVPASSVAKLLKLHSIPFAVLNSCESARANAGDDANIAKSFQNVGVRGVLAMSFKVSSHAAETFLTSFYGGILLQGQSFSQSAREARRILRSDSKRPSRFGLKREVLDWFVPVCYSHHKDFVLAPESKVQAQSTPQSLVSADANPCSSDRASVNAVRLFGRDFDLLRLEKVLTKKKAVYVHGVFGVGKTVFLKHAQEIWTSTSLVDVAVYIDLASSDIENADDIAELVTSKIEEIGNFEKRLSIRSQASTLSTTEQTAAFARLQKLLQGLRIVIVFDRLQDAFSAVLPEVVRNSSKNAATSLRMFLSSLSAPDGENTDYVAPYFIFAGRKDFKWFHNHLKPLIEFASFELSALQLSDALDLAQSLLSENADTERALDRLSLDDIESITELLQNNPGTMCEVLPYLNDAQVKPQHRYQYLRKISNVNLFERSNSYPKLDKCCSEVHRLCALLNDRAVAILIILSLYWHEGPRVGSIYNMLLSFGFCSDIEPFRNMIDLLTDRGYIAIAEGNPQIAWIYPMFTLCLRSLATLLENTHRIRSSEYLSNSHAEDVSESLPLAVKAGQFSVSLFCANPPVEHSALTKTEVSNFCENFLEGLEMQWQLKFMLAISSGIDVADMSDFYLHGFLNTLSCIDIITTRVADVPLKCWPHTLFERSSAHVKLVGTVTQKKWSAKKIEKLVKSFIAFQGYAVDPEYFYYTQNLCNYLVWSHLVGGLSDSSSTQAQELHQLSSDILKASEEKYGTMREGMNLYVKAYTVRLEAMLRLVEGKYEEALDIWKRFMELDDLWIKYLEQQSQLNSQQDKLVSLAQFGASFILGTTRDKRQAAEMQQRLQSAFQFNVEKAYAESRKQSTAIIEAMVKTGGAVKPEDWEKEVLPAMAAFTHGFKNVADVQRAAGLRGLENHPDAWPANSDLVAESRRYDDRPERLYALDNATDSGDWVRAAGHHQALARTAFESADIDEALTHATAMLQIYEQDPTSTTSLKDAQSMQLLLQGQQAYFDAILDPSTASSEKLAQIIPALDQMIEALKLQGAPPHSLEGLELTREMWSKQAEEGFEKMVSIMRAMTSEDREQPKDKFKRFIQLVSRHAGDKQYTADIAAEQTRIMQLFKQSSELEQTGDPEDLIRALEVLDELESLKSTDSGSILINMDDIEGDRARFRCKHDCIVAINKWHDEHSAGRYQEALSQIALLETRKQTATRINLNISFAHLDEMYTETEQSLWNSMFTSTLESEKGSPNRIQLWTTLLDAHHQHNRFPHLDTNHLRPLLRSAYRNRLLDLAMHAHTTHDLESCITHYTEWLATAQSAEKLLPGFTQLFDMTQSIQLIHYNNKYAQADADCDFDAALTWLDKLDAVFRTRVQRLESLSDNDRVVALQIPKARHGLAICVSIVQAFGPVQGMEVIREQRRVMGYRAPSRSVN